MSKEERAREREREIELASIEIASQNKTDITKIAVEKRQECQ